mmetsp:Transcript_21383/g.31827  ORF Transcript_21383/g.31827 Transcript_21383/m.31827 type:complete len:233 (+) Transcript_21383:69-767(+)
MEVTIRTILDPHCSSSSWDRLLRAILRTAILHPSGRFDSIWKASGRGDQESKACWSHAMSLLMADENDSFIESYRYAQQASHDCSCCGPITIVRLALPPNGNSMLCAFSDLLQFFLENGLNGIFCCAPFWAFTNPSNSDELLQRPHSRVPIIFAIGLHFPFGLLAVARVPISQVIRAMPFLFRRSDDTRSRRSTSVGCTSSIGRGESNLIKLHRLQFHKSKIGKTLFGLEKP